MKEKIFRYLIILLFASIAFQGCSIFARRYGKTVNKQYQLTIADKDGIKFENLSGRVKVFQSDDSLAHLTVKAELKVKREELDKIDDKEFLTIDSGGKYIRINEESSDVEIGYSNMHFGPLRKVTYELYLPEYKPLSIYSKNSSMEINETSNNLKVEIINGNLVLNNPIGYLTANIINGKISGNIDSSKGLEGTVTNGNISIKLSKDFSGSVNCTTENGSVKIGESDFDNVDIKTKNAFSGSIGKSDVKVKLNVTNGKIKISSEKQSMNEDD